MTAGDGRRRATGARVPGWLDGLRVMAPVATRRAAARILLTAALFAVAEAAVAALLALVALELFTDPSAGVASRGGPLALLPDLELGWLLLTTAGAVALRAVLLVRREVMEERVARDVGTEALETVLRGILGEDLRSFAGRDRENVRRTLLELDDVVRSGVVRPASLIAGEALVVVGLLAFLTAVNPIAVGSIAMLLGVLVLLLRAIVLAPGNRLTRLRGPLREDAFRLVEMFVRAQREIRVSGASEDLTEHISTYFARVGEVEGRLRVLRSLPRKVIELAFLGLLLAAAGLLAESGGITSPQSLSTLVVLVYAAFRVQPSLQLIVDAQGTLSNDAQRLREVARMLGGPHGGRSPTGAAGPAAGSTTRGTGATDGVAIELRDVLVRGGGHPVLIGIDLAIPAGAFVAIVGPSGAGKSTLLDIITGLRRPDQGQVLLDGAPLEDPTRQLWPLTGYVAQSTFVFPGTLAENLLTVGPVDPDRWRVCEQALELTGLGPILGAPQSEGGCSFDPALRLGEGGRSLSGGEAQRLALARALVSSRGLLVLDEATSALDGPSQSAVLSAIARNRSVRTVVMVSHDLVQVERADVVHLLVDGRLVASGTHDELLRSNATYRGLRATPADD